MKVLKILFEILSVLVVLIVGAVLTIWMKPSLVLNSQSLHWALGKQSAIKIPTGAEKLSLDATKNGFWKLGIRISSEEKVCIDAGETPVRGCLEKLLVNVEIHLDRKLGVRLSQLGPIELRGSELKIGPFVSDPKKNAASSAPGPSFFAVLPRYLDPDFKLNQILLAFPSVQAWLPQPWQAKVALETRVDPLTQGRTFVTLVDVIGPGKERFGLNGSFSAGLDSSYASRIDVTGAIGKTIRAEVKANGKGSIDAAKGQWDASARVQGVSEYISKIEVPHIEFAYGDGLHLKLKGAVGLDLGETKVAKNSAVKAVSFHPTIQLSAAIDQPSKSPEYRFAAEILPIEEHGVQLHGKIAGTAPSDFDWQKILLSAFHFELRVPRFQTTVQSLRMTQLAIPAPLNALEGEMHLSLGNAGALTKTLTPEFPVDLGANLNSRSQHVRIKTNGQIKKRDKPSGLSLDADVMIQQITLQLPQLDPLVPIPTISRDSRIQKSNTTPTSAESESSDPPFFQANVRIHTSDPGISLLYEHFDPAALLTADLHIDGENGMTGQIATKPFAVKFLNQTANVDRMSIKWTPDAEGPQISGRFSISRTDYMIYADVTQNESQKTIILSSDPALAQSDIISVLLFNQVSTDLDSQDAQSAQSTQSAITARALGVFTLWALASTPIEAVNYNPATQTYSAKVRIGGGVSAEVGSDWDNSQTYGLRKRLGKNWVLSTQVRTENGGQQIHESFLEWYKRF